MWQLATISDKFKKLRCVPASNSIFFLHGACGKLHRAAVHGTHGFDSVVPIGSYEMLRDATSIANDELGQSKENKEPRIAQSKLTPTEGLVWPPSPGGKRPGAAPNWRLVPKCPAPRGESNRWWQKSPGSSFQLWSPSRFQPAQWRWASGLRTWHLAEFPSQEATLHPACSEDCEASLQTGPRPMPWRARTWDMRSLELLESNLRINHSPCKLPKFP